MKTLSIETILLQLPDLAISDLTFGSGREPFSECCKLSRMTADGIWCNGFSDTLTTIPAAQAFEWIEKIERYFGNVTCKIYFKDAEGVYHGEFKDVLTSPEELFRDFNDNLLPF